MRVRLAEQTDVQEIMHLIAQAKAFLAEQKIDQWQNGYPDMCDILQDIAQQNGYVAYQDDEITGYVCISFDGEPCYDVIKGKWQSKQAYATIHRMTVANKQKGKGLAGKLFDFAEQLCAKNKIHSIRVDTDEKNLLMQRVFAKQGFVYCGVVDVGDSEKIAFEKQI